MPENTKIITKGFKRNITFKKKKKFKSQKLA